MLRRLLPLGLLAVVAAAPSALAHDHAKVLDDRYELSIGFLTEPAYVDEPNGVTLRVTNATSKQNVSGLESDLAVTISIGGKTTTIDMEPVFRTPGSYVGRFIPTAEGTYSFRFAGTIEGAALDYTHTYLSEPVVSRGVAEFPDKGLANVDTQKKLADLEARVSELESQREGNRDAPVASLAAVAALALVAVLRRR